MLARNGFILDQRKYTNDPIHQDYIQILAGMNTDDSIQVIAGDITRTQMSWPRHLSQHKRALEHVLGRRIPARCLPPR